MFFYAISYHVLIIDRRILIQCLTHNPMSHPFLDINTPYIRLEDELQQLQKGPD
jgi:hypothetical protein